MGRFLLLGGAVLALAAPSPASAQSGTPIDTVHVGAGMGSGEVVTGTADLVAGTEYVLVATGQLTQNSSQQGGVSTDHDSFYCFPVDPQKCSQQNSQNTEFIWATTATKPSDQPGFPLSHYVQPSGTPPPFQDSHEYTVTVKFGFSGKLRVSTQHSSCDATFISCAGPGYTLKIYAKAAPQPEPTPTPTPEPDPCAGAARAKAHSAQSCKRSTVMVSEIEGEVAYRINAGEWMELKKGQQLPPGAEIFTGVDSKIVFTFSDATYKFTVEELSQLLIDTIEDKANRKDVAVRLKVGQLNSQVKKEKVVDTNFEVQTPTATASVRGTEFTTSYDAVAKVTVETTTEGVVEVDPKGAGLPTRMVPAGKEVAVRPHSISKLTSPDHADARGGISRQLARELVLARVGAAMKRCKLTTPRSQTVVGTSNAPKGWFVSVMVGGKAKGRSRWRVGKGSVKPANAIAKRIARGCR